MDPVTIVQIVRTAVSLSDVVIKCIVGLRELKRKYYNAPLVVSTIIGQLDMAKAALDQLAKWNKPERDRDPRFQQLALQIDSSIDCFSPLVTSLEQRLKDFELTSKENLSTTQRLTFLWDEREISEFSVLLDRQVNAFNLLLQAINCNTLAQQQELLLREESQSILQQGKDCSSSIIGLEDSSSFISENTAGISLAFDFDRIILASKIYRKAGRSHLRQAIKAHSQSYVRQKPEPIPEEDHFDSESPRHQASHPSGYVTSEASSPRTQGGAVSKPNKSNSQPAARANSASSKHNSVHMERDTMSLDFTSEDKLNASSRARILRLVNPWRKAPKTKIETSIARTGPLKLMILGTSESGKSTALQRLKLVLEGGYTVQERMNFKQIIWSNIITGTRLILQAMGPLPLSLGDENNARHVETIYRQRITIDFTQKEEVAEAISSLWCDEEFQCAYQRRNEYSLTDSAAYYAREIQRVMSPDYIPTNEDILYARCQTIGINEMTFSESALLKDLQCRFFDVGGTRSDRIKWIHTYAHVSVVLFTVDTTAYAKVVHEDRSVNRMHEQLIVWDSIVNDKWFAKTVFVLIFTRLDMLEDYMRREPVEDHLDYPHLSDRIDPVHRYMQYLTERFLSLVQRRERVERIRIVQGNLVHGSEDTTFDIVNAVGDLVARYPALNGVSYAEWKRSS